MVSNKILIFYNGKEGGRKEGMEGRRE